MVPVTVRLPAQHFGAAALAALGQGSTLPLAPLTQGLQVELLVGGRKIAEGEIVEIGDNFGILIAQTAGVSKPAQPHGSTEIPTSDDGED
jgi:flagellar motor switch/type III secretory pathway protein FliN